MYALPEMAAANAALWEALRAALAAEMDESMPLPAHLSPVGLSLPAVIDPTTLFSQMCGYPLQTLYRGQYRLLGTPLYDLPGCRLGDDGVPRHCSFLIVASAASVSALEELRGARFAMNGGDSNSGMNLPRRLFAPLARDGRFFSDVRVSGSHMRSMEMVAAGQADTAAIDCVTFGYAARYRPQLAAGLRVLAETPDAPAIPFITAAATPDETAARITHLLTTPPPALRDALATLAIQSITPPLPAAYEAVTRYEAEAAALGYPALC